MMSSFIMFVVHSCSCDIILFRQKKQTAKAAREKWPANTAHVFRGTTENLKALEELVVELKTSCATKHFDEKAVRTYVLNTQVERRRQLKGGHDRTKVCIAKGAWSY